MATFSKLTTLLLLFLFQSTLAYYIPGWSIKSYHELDPVPLYFNKISSDHSPLPYSYSELPFVCGFKAAKEAHNSLKKVGLNLGEVLRGDRIVESRYNLAMMNESTCVHACDVEVDKNTLQRAFSLIKAQYSVEWIVDNLPGATAFVSVDRSSRYYAAGFPLGYMDLRGRANIHNHVILLIRYRKAPGGPPKPGHEQRYVIVAFEVYPKSVAAGEKECPGNSDTYDPYVIDTNQDSAVIPYTYSVYWREDESIAWENRWNKYLSYSDESAHVHWLALVNSLVIAALLATFVAIIVIRTLNRDIHNYNTRNLSGLENSLILGTGASADDKEFSDLSGWKLVFADVFRPPVNPSFFAALIGSGAQLVFMLTTVVGFACLGVLNPSYRGGFLSYALFLFAFAGIFSGYVAARISKNFGSTKWGKTALLTATFVPGLLMSIVIILNFFIWSQASSSALPFGTLLALVCIWFFISCPLVLAGSFIGNKMAPTPLPVEISRVPRQIPRQSRHKHFIPSVLLGGLLPFAVIFVELRFVYKSVWQTQSTYYYMYGFLALVFLVLILTVMEMSIVITYFQLNTEDYRWWWKSFMVGTGSAWWVFIYSVYYYFMHLDVDGFVPSLVFFSYSLIGSIVYGIVTGAIGFLASYYFVFKIYGAIKAD